MRTTPRARHRGADAVTSGSGRERVLFGVHVSAQAVVIVLAALGFAVLVGAMVLSWLERTT